MSNKLAMSIESNVTSVSACISNSTGVPVSLIGPSSTEPPVEVTWFMPASPLKSIKVIPVLISTLPPSAIKSTA